MKLNKAQLRLAKRLISGAVIFISVLLLNHFIGLNLYLSLILLTSAYFILGFDVLKAAYKNILRGKVFDENFLMCIATIGAYFLGDYKEAVGVMLFYQLGEFFQSYAVAKSRKSIKSLMDICPEYANIEYDGRLQEVLPDEVNIGDIIVVKPGEKLPLDGIITEGASSLDMASLTGESLPKDVAAGDDVLSGSINILSTIKIKVTKSFENSTVSKILELMENSGFNKAKSEKFITKFARVYTPIVVICALLTAFVPPIFFGSLLTWIERSLIFLVISCPCALVVSIPMSFFAALGCASRHGILIKGSNYLEALGNIEAIVFDKTGTLTEGNFTICEIHPEGCSKAELTELAAAAEYYSEHPVANAVKKVYHINNAEDISSFTNIAGLGVGAVYKSKNIFAGNSRLMKEHGITSLPSPKTGVAIHIAADNEYMGYIAIGDTIKNNAAQTIASLKKSGIKTYILSGDKKENVSSVANELGTDKFYAELLPQDKVEKLGEILLQKSSAKRSIAYVGDGINDAPVLSLADVGIAMGSLGSDAAIEAADIVITDDNISKISLAIKICRKTTKIAGQNIIFALGVKIAVMALGVLGFASMWAAVFADVGVAFIAILNSMRAFNID